MMFITNEQYCSLQMKTFKYHIHLQCIMLKEEIKVIVEKQREQLQSEDIGIKRELLIDILPSFSTIISGIRRCGKSTLLRQVMTEVKDYYYFNFEDERTFNFKVEDFQKLDEVFKDLYGESNYYFFDEIQSITGWELFIRRLVDAKKKVILTGSNASLLSKELGTKLTGRHITKELFPFSYREYLQLAKEKPGLESFNNYQKRGGFPDFIKYKKEQIVQEVLKDILFRDIIARYGLRNDQTIQSLARYLLTNIGKEFSYHKLQKYLKVGSVNTVIAYMSYLENSYLIFTAPRFSFSYKKQLISPKKVYCIDNGLAQSVTSSFSQDQGRMLENTVFLHLRKNNDKVFYFKGEKECDFITSNKNNVEKAVQVCVKITNENIQREIEGLHEARKQTKAKDICIITVDQEEKIENIQAIPAWKWLIKN